MPAPSTSWRRPARRLRAEGHGPVPAVHHRACQFQGHDRAAGSLEIAAALQIVRRGAGDSSEAATNFNNILQKINSNDAIKNFKKHGVDIRKVLKDAVKTGADPLEAALRAIKKAIKGDTSRLGELFDDAQVQKGLLPLLNGLDDYIQIRDQTSKASGVVDRDFARMMETGVEKTKALRIALQNLATSIGNALIPILGDAARMLKPLVEGLIRLVDAHPRIAGALVAITAGFIGLKAALAGLSYLGLMGKGGMLWPSPSRSTRSHVHAAQGRRRRHDRSPDGACRHGGAQDDRPPDGGSSACAAWRWRCRESRAGDRDDGRRWRHRGRVGARLAGIAPRHCRRRSGGLLLWEVLGPDLVLVGGAVLGADDGTAARLRGPRAGDAAGWRASAGQSATALVFLGLSQAQEFGTWISSFSRARC